MTRSGIERSPDTDEVGHRGSEGSSMAAVVYILQNEDTGKYYIGSTENLDRRFKEHQRGIVDSTKSWPHKKVVLAQEYPDIQTAAKIENRLKAFKSRVILEKIVREGKIKISEWVSR